MTSVVLFRVVVTVVRGCDGLRSEEHEASPQKESEKRGGRQSVEDPAAELTLPALELFTIRMHRKKEVVPPAAGALGASLIRSERRKQSAAERLTRSGSTDGDKKDHKSSVVESAPRDNNSFLRRSRSGSGDHTSSLLSSSPPARQYKRSGSGNGDNATFLLSSSSPPVDKRQYKTSSSPGLSPNITRQKKIFLSSASKTFRPPKFNKEGTVSTDDKGV